MDKPPIDYLGPHGGALSMAFGAGCAAASAFWAVIGRWLFPRLEKGWKAEKALLIKRIEHLEADLEEERHICRRDMSALNDRIRILEAMTLGGVRQQAQAAISEMRVHPGG
ncbi:MAG: hypothetical protein E2598_07440 [Sphingobium sp.]|nr:hypothetical protein [Sphingobium sp.]